jgi:rifampicin phosphotransferase
MSEQRRRIRKGIGPFAAFRLSRAAESIERDFRETFLPDYMSELRLLEAMDFRKVPTSDLIGLLEDTTDRYFHDSHVQVDTINIAADFYVKAAERAMSRRGMNSGAVLGQGAASVMHRAMDLLRQLRHGEATAEEFLAVFGHRSPVDYELSMPRYREDMTMMESLIRSAATSDSVPHSAKTGTKVPEDPTLALMIMRAHRFQALKEEAKHYSLREFSVVRQMFVELDRRMALDGGIFYLEFDEIAELRNGGRLEDLKQRIATRRGAAEFFEDMRPLETGLTLRDLETLGTDDAGADDRSDETGALQGSLVAGSAVVTGRARVLTGQDISPVRDGEIVVARYMHPSWTPAFPRLQGIVTEVGGWLSHTSILAREYDITTIIGVRAAEFRIQTGDTLRLNLDGSVDILERAAPEAGIGGDAGDSGSPLAGVPDSDNAMRGMARSSVS